MYGYNLGLAKARVSESIPAAPANVVLPSLVGNGAVGSVVTCSAGAWSGSPSPTFTFNFKLDTVSVQSGASNTYTPLIGDDTKTLTCTVTATNTEGSANANTSNSLVVGTAPSNTVAPVISGTNTFGSTLTTTNGTFTGTSPLTYTYQWLRGGSPISGETLSTYVIGASDSLAAITCEVKATNTYGFDSEVSNTITVQDFAPINTVAPTVSPIGTQSTGTLITANVGTWTGVAPITYEYKWTRDGLAISGSTASTYTIQLADDGTTIRVEVKGTNTYGTSAFIASSNSVSAVNVIAPVNTVAPVISGTAVVGQTLTSTTGTWTGDLPISYSYQWKRGATNIGTNASTYTLVQADAGNIINITCVVTATNAGGSVNATSNTIVRVMDATANTYLTSAVIADNVIVSAQNQLTISRKALGVTDLSIIAEYPFLTTQATNTDRLNQFKFNSIKPTGLIADFNLTYGGTVTANTTGIQGNGVNGYANTNIFDNLQFTTNEFTIIWASRTNSTTGFDFGITNSTLTGGIQGASNSSGNTISSAFGPQVSSGALSVNTQARFILTKRGTTVTLKRNGVVLFTRSEANNTRTSRAIPIMCRGYINTTATDLPSNREYSYFAFINGAITDAQETSYDAILSTFMSSLSR